MTLTIIVAIVAFLAVTLVLVGLLLYAKAKLTSSGDVTIDINNGERVITNLFAALQPILEAGARQCADAKATLAVQQAQAARAARGVQV